ncbi:hypothetical protein KEM56_004742, partial [Ascosphaera pollenicola]
MNDQLSRELHAQNTTLHRFTGTPQRAWMTAGPPTAAAAAGTASGTARKRSHAGPTIGSGGIAMGALVSVSASSTSSTATANAPAMLPPA